MAALKTYLYRHHTHTHTHTHTIHACTMLSNMPYYMHHIYMYLKISLISGFEGAYKTGGAGGGL